MKLEYIPLKKKDLKKIPPKERGLFLGLSHAANEMMIFQKLAYIAFNSTSDHEIENLILGSQAVTVLNVCIGKIYEAYELLKEGYYDSQLSKIYKNKLSEENKIALKNLNKYFGKSDNRIKKVRNKLSNHFNFEYFSSDLKEIPDNESLNYYLNDITGNCFFYGANQVLNFKFYSDLSNSGDINTQLKEIQLLMDDVFYIIDNMELVIIEWITITLNEYVPDNTIRPVKPKFKKHPPKLSEYKIPFFMARGNE